MATENSSINGSSAIPNGAELARMVENGEWDKVKELLAMSEEEVERILQQPMIDAAIVHRLMEEMDKHDDQLAELANRNGNG